MNPSRENKRKTVYVNGIPAERLLAEGWKIWAFAILANLVFFGLIVLISVVL